MEAAKGLVPVQPATPDLLRAWCVLSQEGNVVDGDTPEYVGRHIFDLFPDHRFNARHHRKAWMSGNAAWSTVHDGVPWESVATVVDPCGLLIVTSAFAYDTPRPGPRPTLELVDGAGITANCPELDRLRTVVERLELRAHGPQAQHPTSPSHPKPPPALSVLRLVPQSS